MLSDFANGESTAITIDGRRLVVVRIDDDVFILSDRCSHEDFPLATGEVDVADGTIECARHGALFDLHSGAPLSLPATEAVATFSVSIQDGRVYINEEWA
jgi:3-phenylpropionate/trans-cinnamate dioxygenase ferredoxin subunit